MLDFHVTSVIRRPPAVALDEEGGLGTTAAHGAPAAASFRIKTKTRRGARAEKWDDRLNTVLPV
jgi:hypothetical protein